MIGQHLRHNVIAYLALVVALTGTSYAAAQLQKGQVKSKHLANNAVTSKKVKNGTLKAADIGAGVLPKGTSRVVARARFKGDQPGTLLTSSVPLTGATWTQAANDVDQFFGSIKVDYPSTAQCGANKDAVFTVTVDGIPRLKFQMNSDDSPAAGTSVFQLLPSNAGALSEPGAATPHTVAAYFFDACSGSIRYHVREVKISVVGVS